MTNQTQSFQPFGDGRLPFFCQEQADYTLFYAPGYLAVVATSEVDAFGQSLTTPQSAPSPPAAALIRRARAAKEIQDASATRPFAPVCLTLYLNNECNLRCTYCYAAPSSRPAARLSLPAIRTAAAVVLDNCRRQQRPFTLVCHGGGEPTRNRHVLNQALDELEEMAAAYGLPLFRYVATNGVMSTEKARWLAQRFDLIGLSCDGPAWLQKRQRPLPNGNNSTPFVERTAQTIHRYGKPLHVRVTITPQSMPFQPNIAQYICQALQPEEIRVEPVYQAGRAGPDLCFTAEQSDAFIDHFRQARQVAGQYGVPWLMSGSRSGEIHGRYCHLFRDVLNLVPGDVATACFKVSEAVQARQMGVEIGQMDAGNGRFVLDFQHIQTLRQSLQNTPLPCQNCFNQFHCTFACPDHCPLTEPHPAVHFRCLVQQKLMAASLQAQAQALWGSRSALEVMGTAVTIA
jgi:sulfatase maturation enzyme AslB (radical SAM superfamily)